MVDFFIRGGGLMFECRLIKAELYSGNNSGTLLLPWLRNKLRQWNIYTLTGLILIMAKVQKIGDFVIPISELRGFPIARSMYYTYYKWRYYILIYSISSAKCLPVITV